MTGVESGEPHQKWQHLSSDALHAGKRRYNNKCKQAIHELPRPNYFLMLCANYVKVNSMFL